MNTVTQLPVKYRASKKRGKKNIPDNVLEFPDIITLTRKVRMSKQIREAMQNER